jgi:proteasome lid subunit RPN8/RPN11
MGDHRLRLSPPEPPEVVTAHIPRASALRWQSADEDEGLLPALTVFITQRAFVRVCAHAGSDLQNEMGGALAGKWRVDAASGRSFVVVEAVLPAPFTRQGSTFVTFTQDSLVALNDELESRCPGKKMVGWYHTHPRMGIFLSGYDTWLHEHFFPEPWQVALVIDPHAVEGGFFIRDADGDLQPQRYFGFGELLDARRRSVVHWHNVRAILEEQVQAGG